MSQGYLLTAPHAFDWAPLPEPRPKAGEVVVQTRFVGLCGTDLHIAEGDHPRARFPIALGHELIGLPETGPLAGRLVLVDPLIPCGKCIACRRGASNACAQLRLLGIDRHGALAGRVAVAADRLHLVPDGLAEDIAPLAEPLAVASHALRRVPSLAGCIIAVVGGGPVGLLLAHLARRAGASVLVAEPAPNRRRLIELLGFELLDPSNPVGDLETRTAGDLADGVFDAAASPSVAAALHRFVGPTGWIGVVGTYAEPTPVDLQAVMFKELSLVGHRTYLPRDLDSALALLTQDQSLLRPLLTAIITPAEVGPTLHALRSGKGMKFVVEWS